MKEVHVEALGLINQGHTSPETSANRGHKLFIQILDVAERYLLKLHHLSSRNTLLKIMKMPACKINKSCDKDEIHHTSNSRKCMGVNGEALQLHAVYKKQYFSTTSHARFHISISHMRYI